MTNKYTYDVNFRQDCKAMMDTQGFDFAYKFKMKRKKDFKYNLLKHLY